MTTYTFKGEKIPLPDPGTYDATKWTPPTHKSYTVDFQNDGLWRITVGSGAVVDMGEGEKPSRKRALELIEDFLDRGVKLSV